MSDGETIWRCKTEEQLLEAAGSLEDYTDEGERVIRAELRRRGLPEPLPVQRATRAVVESAPTRSFPFWYAVLLGTGAAAILGIPRGLWALVLAPVVGGGLAGGLARRALRSLFAGFLAAYFGGLVRSLVEGLPAQFLAAARGAALEQNQALTAVVLAMLFSQLGFGVIGAVSGFLTPDLAAFVARRTRRVLPR